jgi:NAD(P)-dependent dehydrogenase (short-subunit alcohol dehydrogenase family)
MAKALAAEGAWVAVADIIADNAAGVAREIEAAGGTAAAIACDVSDRASVRQAKEEANEALGPVSLLFANAGAVSYQRLTEMSDDDIDWIFQVDLMGVVHCMRAFLPDMIATRAGHAVATASVSGLSPGWQPHHSAYSSAKIGVIGLMLNLRHELSEFGVGASVLIPGGVASGMKENNARYRPKRYGGPSDGEVEVPDAVLKLFAESGLVFRPAEDVAQMVLLAIRENRPIIVTSLTDRRTFQETYVDPVMTAFDQVAAVEASLAR